MVRLVGAWSALLVFAGLLLAEDYQGIVKKLDKEKNKITLIVDKDTITLEFNKDPLLLNDKGKGLPGGLGAIKPGWEVKLSTDKKGDKDIITTLKVIEMKTLKVEEYQGILKTITKDKKITITVENKNVTLGFTKDAKFVNDKDKSLSGGIAALKTGWEVLAILDKKSDKETIQTLKVLDMKGKK
jgi:hypothetical protein